MSYQVDGPVVVGPASGSRARRFKDRLATDTFFGGWLTVPELSVAEIMAASGFDYLIVDAEHSPWTVADIQMALAAFANSQTVLLVRIPSHDPVFIKQVLDVGVDGIICPIVRTAAEAELLVSECRYPPAGIRGFGPRRASAYGRDTDSYTRRANDDVIIIPQIEDAAYLEEVDGILDVDGIDALCLGPTDLSGSMGLLRQFDHPDVVRALDSVMAKAQSRGLPVCTGIVLGADVQLEWVSKGARLTLVAADTALIAEGASASITATREALGG